MHGLHTFTSQTNVGYGRVLLALPFCGKLYPSSYILVVLSEGATNGTSVAHCGGYRKRFRSIDQGLPLQAAREKKT